MTLLLWVAGYGFTADGIVPAHAQLASAAVVASVDADSVAERGERRSAAGEGAGRPDALPSSQRPALVDARVPLEPRSWLRPPVRAPSST